MDQLTLEGLPDWQVLDELAACLERFLAARVDERTMERAQLALARWHSLAEPIPVSGES